MFFRLLVLFTVVPLVELSLLIRIGRTIDVGPTIALVVLTGVAGAALAKHQGLRTLRHIQAELAAGGIPGKQLVDGVMILAAGLLLVTPGVITDGVGFALLVPPARALLRRRLTAWFRKRMVIVDPRGPDATPAGKEFVDVEARVVDPDADRPEPPA